MKYQILTVDDDIADFFQPFFDHDVLVSSFCLFHLLFLKYCDYLYLNFIICFPRHFNCVPVMQGSESNEPSQIMTPRKESHILCDDLGTWVIERGEGVNGGNRNLLIESQFCLNLIALDLKMKVLMFHFDC